MTERKRECGREGDSGRPILWGSIEEAEGEGGVGGCCTGGLLVRRESLLNNCALHLVLRPHVVSGASVF